MEQEGGGREKGEEVEEGEGAYETVGKKSNIFEYLN